ncbi:MAG: HAD-IIIA family hydrolase [Acidobacteriota bacterium]|nr:HAD-IIIA family hydrolase [Acidobacteriota bacterium]
MNDAEPAVLLDRDGVINYDSHSWVMRFEDIVFFPGSLEAIARLTQAGRRIYVVTNQAWVSKRLLPEPEAVLQDTLTRLRGAVAESGGEILDIAACPHQDSDQCDCRKPAPGLLLKIAQEHRVDLSRSVMCGDSWRDVEAAAAAGVGTMIFLRTRPTQAEVQAELDRCRPPDFQAKDLAEAAEIILEHGLGA